MGARHTALRERLGGIAEELLLLYGLLHAHLEPTARTAPEDCMDPSILLQPNTLPDVIGGVVALPIGLFLAFIVSPVNMRGWALFGGLLGAALAATGLYYYVDLAHIPIDGVSYVIAALLVATTGCVVGSLLLNGMFGRDERKRAARARHKTH